MKKLKKLCRVLFYKIYYSGSEELAPSKNLGENPNAVMFVAKESSV